MDANKILTDADIELLEKLKLKLNQEERNAIDEAIRNLNGI